MLYLLFLSFRFDTIILLPALLQVLQTDVAYTLVRALWVSEVVDGSLYGKEQWSCTGT
jgi:hypothetical protein